MLHIRTTSPFRKSLKKLLKSGFFSKKDRDKLKSIVESLKNELKLDQKYRDHELSGQYAGIRECHVKPDLLLMYKVRQEILTLVLINLGSHSELFD